MEVHLRFLFFVCIFSLLGQWCLPAVRGAIMSVVYLSVGKAFVSAAGAAVQSEPGARGAWQKKRREKFGAKCVGRHRSATERACVCVCVKDGGAQRAEFKYCPFG